MIFIIIAIIVIVLIAILTTVYKFIEKKKNFKKIIDKFASLGYIVTFNQNNVYDMTIEKDNQKTFVKVIFNPKRDEINVNSKEYFQLNHGVVSSRKKGEKIEGVYDLLRLKVKDEKKLYLIYPSSKRLMKVLNECEMDFIDNNTDIYGAKMWQFDQL